MWQLPENVSEALFCVIHPRMAIDAKFAQLEVAFGYRQPPPDSTEDVFPQLSLRQVAKLLNQPQRTVVDIHLPGDGVPLGVWSMSDKR